MKLRRLRLAAVLVLLSGCEPAAQHLRATVRDPLAHMPDGYPELPLGDYKSPQLRPGQNEVCSIAVGLSGGGSLSAAFGWGVLEYLSEYGYPGDPLRDAGRFLYEVDYYSTASGGGITAALVLEMMREFAIRDPVGPDFDPSPLQSYFESARFRGVLDWRMLSFLRFAGGLLEGGSAGAVRRELESALSGLADTECRCREELANCTDDLPNCRLTPPLTFADLFIEPGETRLPTLPIWYATTTVYHSGHVLPVTPAMLKLLEIRRIRFGEGWFGGWEEWVPVEQLDMLHALTLSMAFPGIGPVVAETGVPLDTGEPTSRVFFADGGQSDNLGLILGLRSVATDLQRGVSKKGLVLVVDAALESRYPNSAISIGVGRRLHQSLFNSTPLLAAQRRQAGLMATSLAHEWLRERHGDVSTHFLRAADVLDDDVPVQFCDLARNCLDENGFPEGRPDCFRDATCGAEQKLLPRKRIRHEAVTLALPRQQVEDLVAVGRRAAERALQDLPDGTKSPLRKALRECLLSRDYVERSAADRPALPSP